ncbi:MAG: ATPase F0F1 [Sphingobacteriales bacterium]|nr:MAG: ATPase F0F1 [Sphingobacteriales bacterium]
MSDQQGKYRSAMRFVGLGTQWMVMLLLAVWAGNKLDHMTGWKFPLFIVSLPLMALGISLWQVIRIFNKPQK